MPDATDFVRELIRADLAAGKHGGALVTRFPPEPNGFPHIGHAKSICLNFGVARELGGRCHLRFDDSNPTTEDERYVRALEDAVRWLGFDWGERRYFASDTFERLFELSVGLIERGDAYVCTLTEDDFRACRGTVGEAGHPSPGRSRSAEESLRLFQEMRRGEHPDGAMVLRARIDMASPNMKLRDPPLWRIRHAAHYRLGTSWRIFPLYDFVHPLCDALEGVTHSLCTLEFENNRALYDWVIEKTQVARLPGARRSEQTEFARLELGYTVMSKRKLLELVEGGHVSGWDDPRLPTLAGMRRRGYTPEAIREFCERIGVAKHNSVVDVALLEHVLREDLSRRSPRVLGVLRPLRLTLESLPATDERWLDAPYWPQDVAAPAGAPTTRRLPLSRELLVEREDFDAAPPPGWRRLAPGACVRLRHACVVRVVGVVRDEGGDVAELRAVEVDEADASALASAKGTIHWVSARHAVPAEVRLYDRLFSAPEPGAGGRDPLLDLNPRSLEVVSARLEPSLGGAAPGDRFQLERHGYFLVDEACSGAGALALNRTVALKDGWAREQARRDPEARGPVAAPARRAAGGARSGGAPAAREVAPLSPAAEALRAEHDLAPDDARALAADSELHALFSATLAAGRARARLVGTWVAGELRARLADRAASTLPVGATELAELVALVDAGAITAATGREVLAEIARSGGSPRALVEARGLAKISDRARLDPIVAQVLGESEPLVARFRSGNAGVAGALVGAVMRATGGRADAELAALLVREHLERGA
ncbi:MAG: glutamine--tRNA ligase/YqeY domain fusion protein [Polyangiaceae bacterium]|nr:glutamine--tRNA ligase/YqeY domain fusion protein [Polyangiaceae bacterium]